jgi:hypothetical protein
MVVVSPGVFCLSQYDASSGSVYHRYILMCALAIIPNPIDKGVTIRADDPQARSGYVDLSAG